MLHLVRIGSFRLCNNILDIANPSCSFYNQVPRTPSTNFQVRQATPEEQNALKSVKASRVINNDPASFTANNIGQWYSVEDGLREKVFFQPLVPDEYFKQFDTFLECTFMIRKPLVDLVQCLELVKPTNPINRYVIYGKHGHGKTLTLLQVAHYARRNKWIVCYVMNAANWARRIKEVAMSISRPGRIDLPLNAAQWLAEFKTMNQVLINEFELKTTRKYNWSEWEVTEEGQPLMDVIEMGLNRVKFATDCICVVLRELRLAASDQRCKLLIAVDGVNAMFVDTLIKREDKSMAPAADVALYHAFRKLFKPVWKNGAVVVTVDQKVPGLRMLTSHLPHALLKPEGFDHFDPFIPVPVDKYSEKEWNSVLDYFISMNWLHSPELLTETGRKEMAYLAGFSPLLLDRLAASAA